MLITRGVALEDVFIYTDKKGAFNNCNGSRKSRDERQKVNGRGQSLVGLRGVEFASPNLELRKQLRKFNTSCLHLFRRPLILDA